MPVNWGPKTDAPVNLLSSALNKLNHKDMIIENISPTDLDDAMRQINHIRDRSKVLKDKIYKRIKSM